MKNFFTLLFITFTGILSAQEISKIDGKYCISNVIELPGKTATEIKDGTKDFLVRYNSDSNFIIDSPSEILDNGSFPVDFSVGGIPITYTILYNISSKFKEGRTKLAITNLKVSQNSAGTTSEVALENFFNNLNSTRAGKKYASKMVKQISSSINTQVKKY